MFNWFTNLITSRCSCCTYLYEYFPCPWQSLPPMVVCSPYRYQYVLSIKPALTSLTWLCVMFYITYTTQMVTADIDWKERFDCRPWLTIFRNLLVNRWHKPHSTVCSPIHLWMQKEGFRIDRVALIKWKVEGGIISDWQ